MRKKLGAALAVLLVLLLAMTTAICGDVPKPEPPKPVKQKRATGYKPLTPERRKVLLAESNARHGARIAMLAKFQTPPAAFDCRDKGWIVPTWDQGSCGCMPGTDEVL